MIKAELKDKNVSVEVKGSTENCMIELVSIMTSLLDKSSVDVDDLAYAVALAIEAKEKIDRGKILRESFIDKLFE